MKFGIFSNGFRHNARAATSYDEDLFEIETADVLGYSEAWISEHLFPLPDRMPVPDLMICRASERTKRIKLGPAVRVLPLYHPLDVAMQAAVCDQLTHGRYLFAFGSGLPAPAIMEQRGLKFEERYDMLHESLDFIIKAWTSTEPFDHHGRFWQSDGVQVFPKPYQEPHMPIAVATDTGEIIDLAGRRGYTLLVAQYDDPEVIRRKAERLVAASAKTPRDTRRSMLTVCRHVYISDADGDARNELREGVNRDLGWLTRGVPKLFEGYLGKGFDPDQATFDRLADLGMFVVGDANSVFDQLKDVYQRTGGFGGLLIVVGKDWSTRQKRARSLELFAEKVAPRLSRLAPADARSSSEAA